MSSATNTIVNNLADRLGEVAKVMGPAIEKVGVISQKVIQETANSGFVNTMIGLGVVCSAIVFSFILIRIAKSITDDDDMLWVLIAGASVIVALAIPLGLIVIATNINNWIAPTKQVILEIVEHIQ